MDDEGLHAISQTARWTALLRARESERLDALFHDPYAAVLSTGPHGETFPPMVDESTSWPIVMRTHLIDMLVQREVEDGADLVINLAAGLDSRPYRMELPPSLRWIEVDFGDLMARKTALLKDSAARCQLTRLAADLTSAPERRELLNRLRSSAAHCVVLTEGFLAYLDEAQAGEIAEDIGEHARCKRWIFDVHLPGLLRVLRRRIGDAMNQAGAELKFGPPDGPEFFARHGWRVEQSHSIFNMAVSSGRLPPVDGELSARDGAKGLSRDHFTGQHRWRVDGLVCVCAPRGMVQE